MAELHREGSAPAACAAGLFPCYLTLKISPLTSFLSKVVKISVRFYKICFMPYSTTQSIQKTDFPEKNLKQSKMGGSRVGRTAVKDSEKNPTESMFFLKDFLTW